MKQLNSATASRDGWMLLWGPMGSFPEYATRAWGRDKGVCGLHHLGPFGGVHTRADEQQREAPAIAVAVAALRRQATLLDLSLVHRTESNPTLAVEFLLRPPAWIMGYQDGEILGSCNYQMLAWLNIVISPLAAKDRGLFLQCLEPFSRFCAENCNL